MRKAIKVLAGLTLMAALPAMAATPGTNPKWVTGYYGGYFWDNADYQKPEHVDMTALTHFVFARIGPGSGWEWPKNRLKLAIYLIVNSPEFAVQH